MTNRDFDFKSYKHPFFYSIHMHIIYNVGTNNVHICWPVVYDY